MAPKNKKNPNAGYALAGLIVALVACIASGLIGVVKGTVAAGIYLPANPDILNRIFYVGLSLIVIGLAVYAILSPDTIRRFLSGRQARYGSNSLIITLAFVGIIIVVNVLAYQNPGFLGSPWDWSKDKSNTLPPETLQILGTLKEKVTATAFYTKQIDPSSAEAVLLKFKTNSGGKFDYTFINPDQDPVAARNAGITGDGKILLTMGENKEIASFASETELTKSLIRLISPTERVVYFLEGHGEAVLESVGGDQLSFAVAKDTLMAKNYTVNSLNLLSTNSIPENALAVIVAGPQKPVSQAEVDLLKKYVDAGGSLVIMENPIIITEFGETKDPLAAYLEKDWGITLNNDLIFDQSSQQVLNAISESADPHPITQGMTYAVIMPQARSISFSAAPIEGVTLTSLLRTSNQLGQSWGETDLSGTTDQYQYNEGVDFSAPLTMAASGENNATGGRVVVAGNSLFASDEVFDAYGNGDMFINSVDWAAEQEDLLNITPRQQTERTLKLIKTGQLVAIFIVTIFVFPGLAVFFGVTSWLSRRKRG